MRISLDYRYGFLCVLIENGIEPKKWFPISSSDYAEVEALLGRPVTSINQQEGLYVDEEGNVFQLSDKGETKADRGRAYSWNRENRTRSTNWRLR